MTKGHAPLIAHIVHHFGMGGMENGMVNLINQLPVDRFRHAIICLDGYTEYRHRIHRPDVDFYALGRRAGIDWRLYGNLWKLLRQLRPDIVHTRNLATLEGQIVAFLAGNPRRIHGEHGRDVFDLDGSNRKYNALRKLIKPLVHHYIAVSKDLDQWLRRTIGVDEDRVTQIYNGVDTHRFTRRVDETRDALPSGFLPDGGVLIGSVGRMAEVKNFPLLVRGFIDLINQLPGLRAVARLAIIGEGMAHARCMEMLTQAGMAELAWLPGARNDVAEIMRAMDIFVLPSLAEGISNTILEAMATGLPIVATSVGGNVELIESGVSGTLVASDDTPAMTRALAHYAGDPELRAAHGQAARRRAESCFSLETMASRYLAVYEHVLARRTGLAGHATTIK